MFFELNTTSIINLKNIESVILDKNEFKITITYPAHSSLESIFYNLEDAMTKYEEIKTHLKRFNYHD